MLVDLTQEFVNADDSPAIDKDTQKPIQLRSLLTQAVLSEFTGDRQPVAAAEKIKRYELFLKLKGADVVDFPVEDIALLKKAMLIFGVLVVGQAHEMLERGVRQAAAQAA